jgi:hypothetical protein
VFDLTKGKDDLGGGQKKSKKTKVGVIKGFLCVKKKLKTVKESWI